ncbi:hypothetical protein COW98_02065 [Candidatus Roizmanbacteria bacterium CG22_combo_CG10-13_8_21_14_all_35_9]|uniref:DUF86 domain-containing protein n=3 Tax=Candidatus Roizmaniibacteriota TaxID=1752723 RepID=A0A2M8F2B8_9BACT|nr:MAG: hypothetical protein COX47_04375 [Candidatus Roizmanbacteria bacterium CG23_combo_of_CG06-09_8_20_14_all_35_49]PIP62794.1 MAG: hypothetical protein COW98_02065 [Candidatus Roizmanbacteria bacterium CG22_combo_CG10-13_8_21_14_all_35_9]PJC33431.1 MAG: hypothetical protein CO048_03100 [Candidatus Roizmanbacteria bacterium CG_4_9_14_0_2_um_filter_35_15]PJC82822.1 MAG: hypothetical protein CO006_01660 [Candidatus Roizmanbacteria bacterium CG_4_8_14_3_um_filter_35_14]
MKRNYKLRIQDILDCINIIESYIKGKSENDFYSSYQLQDSVIRRLEIIGEATKNIPEEVRKKYPDLPWKKMAGLRDVVIHDYSEVVEERVWNTITKELPVAKRLIEKIREDLEKSPENLFFTTKF